MPNASRFNIKIDKGLSLSWPVTWVVASGAANTIDPGTPAQRVDVDAATATGAAIPMVDGDGDVGSAEGQFAGIAKNRSNDTASAAGTCDIWIPLPGMLYRANAKTSSTADTQTEINVLTGKRVVLDLTSDVWSVDTAAADALVNCVVIVGGLPLTSEILFVYASKGTFWDTSTAVSS